MSQTFADLPSLMVHWTHWEVKGHQQLWWVRYPKQHLLGLELHFPAAAGPQIALDEALWLIEISALSSRTIRKAI
jgi:hypothetical protein